MGDIFGGAFDINGDGVTDCGEEFMAYQLISGALTESSGGMAPNFDVEDDGDEDDICCDDTDDLDTDDGGDEDY